MRQRTPEESSRYMDISLICQLDYCSSAYRPPPLLIQYWASQKKAVSRFGGVKLSKQCIQYTFETSFYGHPIAKRLQVEGPDLHSSYGGPGLLGLKYA